MSSLAVDTDELSGVDLLGKSVTDLQTGITVGSDSVSGTLKYVTGYTGFSGDPAEQEGNYLALHIDTGDVTPDRVTIMIVGGEHPAKDVDMSDGIVILRIKNTSQQVQVVAYKDGRAAAKLYDLKNLSLTPKA